MTSVLWPPPGARMTAAPVFKPPSTVMHFNRGIVDVHQAGDPSRRALRHGIHLRLADAFLIELRRVGRIQRHHHPALQNRLRRVGRVIRRPRRGYASAAQAGEATPAIPPHSVPPTSPPSATTICRPVQLISSDETSQSSCVMRGLFAPLLNITSPSGKFHVQFLLPPWALMTSFMASCFGSREGAKTRNSDDCSPRVAHPP